jgi:delta24-sterol reductase
MEQHGDAVREIATQVRQYYACKQPFRISHGSTNSTRRIDNRNSAFVDTSQLRHVLNVDTVKKTAVVEPNVPMDSLVAETLKYGLMPPVVMEFPGITAGGGYAGTSGESSSFKYGFFDRTINSIEMVLGNGDIIRASDHENADLFRGAAGAVGTLGITTLIELRLIEAKRYVNVTYHPVASVAEAARVSRELTADADNDYVDGIMYSKHEGVILAGQLSDGFPPGARGVRFSPPLAPWYYLHVKQKLKKLSQRTSGRPYVEFMPLTDYLFRYDRGGFWVGQSAFEYFRFPFHHLTRWLLDDLLHTRMLYRALHASRQSMSYVVQDLALPYDRAAEFIDYTDEKFGIYPLWLCPLKQETLPTFHPHSKEMEADGKSLKPMLNIGLWGWGPKDPDAFIAANQDLERRLRELGGMKWFYSQAYYSEEDFWQMYDREWYEGLRKKYHAEYLPNVWEKIRVDVQKERLELKTSWKLWFLRIWPFAGIFGLYKATRSGDWRIPKTLRFDYRALQKKLK